jgi:tetratricopeptide (TPR) repeat protein
LEDFMTGATIRRTLSICAMALGLAIVAAPAFAQSGQVKGKVTDAQNAPVDGATVLIENLDKGSKPISTKTNKRGEYIQVGLYPGKYKITVTKGDLSTTRTTDVHLDMLTLDLKLEPGGAGAGKAGTKEEAAKAKAKADAMTKTFAEGVELSNQGKHDEAIAKFQEVLTAAPNCAECYANIGTVQAQAKKYEEAETAYKKAIELKPDFSEAYNGLANVYNSEKKFDLAAEASKKAMDLVSAAPGAAAGAPGAAGGGSASNVFNQGVILWNAGKIPEAKAQFEQAAKLDPNLADAQYWLGMALLNTGDTAGAKPKFESYLKLAPTGQYADTAKSIVASIK